jgi:uncharacterized protein YgiM (DUF1202 family)
MNQETGESKFDRPLSAGEVLLFSEENYGGQEQRITANTSSLDFPIASLQIGPKTGVIVFWEENYGGESQELTGDLPSIKASKPQGNPKSIKIWLALDRPLIAGEILLCKQENYGGQEQLINANTSRLDFPIASLRIGPKTGVTVFSDENYGGKSQELTAELASVKESRLQSPAKSIKIWSLPAKPFTGYWAIGIAEENKLGSVEKIYLSVGADSVLTTSASISEREQFRITDGFTGWASSSYLKKVAPTPPPPPGGKYRATANRVHLREGPGTGFRSLGYIQANEIVTDLGINDNGSWRQVLRHDGLRGWVFARYFTLLQSAPSDEGEPVPQDATRKWVRVTAKLNVREGPGTNFTAIGSLQGGEIVEALEPNGDGSWLRIRRTLDPAEAALGRRKVTLSVADQGIAGQTTTAPSGPLSLGDFRNLTMVSEKEAGFRKFSLLSQDKQWIQYSPKEKHFLKSADSKDRTVFCQSIKIAADETQVGELGQGEAALFENPAYWGKAWVFHTFYPDFNSIAGLNDTISSIQLGPLTGATVYLEPQRPETARKTGQKDITNIQSLKNEQAGEDDASRTARQTGQQDIITNIQSLKNEQVGEDRISSIKIWQIKEPAALKLSFECRLSQDFRKVDGKLEEFSAYRTTLRLPPTVETVYICATDATTIDVDGTLYGVDETEGVPLPNPIRGMVITTDAVGDSGASLRTPGLKIWTDKMPDDEWIMIYPDQQVHKDLANLKQDELWNATCGTDKDGKPLYVIAHPDDPDQLNQQQQKAANAQEMITKVMSTVQYSTDSSGGWQQTISPSDELQNKGWVLHFLTYVVSADTLNLREGPGTEHKPIGFLERNDIVQALEFSADGKWVRVRRLKDDLTGWSSSAYLKTGDRFRVTASKLHLREGPGTDSASLGYIEFNDIVTGIGVDDTGGWRQVRRSDGVTGWSAARYLALVQPLPPSPVPTAPSVVMFQEISQEQVQALRAIAQSPDTGLAQGWDWGWAFTELVQLVQNAISFTAAVIDSSLHFIIDLGNKIIAWVADTAEKVIAFVEGLFSAIGAAIENVIRWLRFVFNWDDILKTQYYLQNLVDQKLEDVCKLVSDARIPVQHFFKSQKKGLIDQFDEAIRNLGGTPDDDTAVPSMPTGDRPNGMLDTIDWILSKIMSGGLGDLSLVSVDLGGQNAPMGAGNDLLPSFLDKTMKTGLGTLGNTRVDIGGVIGTLMNNPDQPLLAVAELLDIFKSMAVGLLNAGEVVMLGYDVDNDHIPGLLDVVASLIKKVNQFLNGEIHIPFISDICALIKASGLVDPHLLEWMDKRFTLLDVISLILAIPITVIYKAVFNEAPFQNSACTAQEAANPDSLAFKLIGSICGIVSGALGAIGNALPKNAATPLIEMASLATGLIAWLTSLYDRILEPALFEWYLFSIEGLQLLVNFISLFGHVFKEHDADMATGIIGVWHIICQCEKFLTNWKEALVNLLMTVPEPLCLFKAFGNESRWLAVGDLIAAGAAGASIGLIFAPESTS